MTEEDLNQIRQIVAESVAESEGRTVKTLTEKQDRAVETIAGEISALRTELTQQTGALTQQVGDLSQRLDNLAPVIISTDARMAAFTRSLDRLITVHGETEGTQTAQQRAIDQLSARVKALEDKAAGHQ